MPPRDRRPARAQNGSRSAGSAARGAAGDAPALAAVRGALAGTARASAARRWQVIAFFLAGSLVLGMGLPQLEYQTNVLEWLPENDENVQAFDTLLRNLTGLGNLEVVYLELDPAKSTVTNVTSERAIRSQDELFRFVQERVPAVEHQYGLAHFVKLVNYANHGNDPDAYTIPEGTYEYQLAWETAWRTNAETLQFSISGDYRGAWIGFIIDGEAFSDDARDTGREIRDAIAAYKSDPDVDNLWKDEFVAPYGFGSGTAKIDDSVREDVQFLGWIAAAFVVACLLVAFRDLRLVAVALATLGVALVWTYGLMGWLGIPLSIANVAIIPLLLGVGIDTTLHVLFKFKEARGNRPAAAGRPDALADVAAHAVSRTGIPILLALATTVAGLLAMALSDSPGMTRLGVLASFSLALIVLLAFTFVPACLAVLGGARRPYPPSRGLYAMGRGIARHPVAVILVVVTATSGLGYLAKDTVYLIDLVQGNFPEDDPTRIAGERLQEQIDAGSLEFVIVQGDVTNPATLDYIRAIEDEVWERGLIARKSNVISLVTLLGNYETLKDGTAGAVPTMAPQYLFGDGDARDQAPDDREGISRAIDEMHADPAWAGIAQLFVSPEKDLTVIIVVPQDDSTSLENAEALWNVLHDVLDAASGEKPADVSAHVYGYRTIPYHFNVYSLQWLQILFAVALVANVAFVGFFTRSPRTVLAAATPLVAAAIAWAGLLAYTGTYVSIFLLFPMIFLTSIGADYAAHLAWRMHEGASIAETFATTGRAVAWVMITDAGAFFVFTWMYLESASTIMRGASLAIATAAVASLLATPVFYAWRRREAPRRLVPEAAGEAAPAPEITAR